MRLLDQNERGSKDRSVINTETRISTLRTGTKRELKNI